MTVALTGTGGLMTRLGLMIGNMNAVNTNRGTTVPDYITALNNQYLAADQDLIGGLYPALQSDQGARAGYIQYLQGLARDTVVQMVNEDVPLNSPTLQNALVELIAQMTTAGAYLTPPTVTASASANGASDRGNGVLIATVTDALQNLLVNCFDETLSLKCTGDSSTGATNFNEPFTLTTPASADASSWLYPAGSGTSLNLNSTNPQADNSQGNVLVNSDFETFTGGLPVGWAAPVPTGVLSGGSSAAYYGSSCLQFAYDATTPLTAVTQLFNSTSGGTPYSLLPDTTYGWAWHGKRTSGLSGAGALRLAFLNASTGAVLADDGSNALSASYTLASALSTSYQTKTGFFRTPRALPAAGVKVAFGLTTAIADAGASIYIDYFALTPCTRIYAGGPLVALFSGSSPWAQGDTITQDINNDNAGKFVLGLQRFFDMRGLGLYFPVSGGGSVVNDALVTT